MSACAVCCSATGSCTIESTPTRSPTRSFQFQYFVCNNCLIDWSFWRTPDQMIHKLYLKHICCPLFLFSILFTVKKHAPLYSFGLDAENGPSFQRDHQLSFWLLKKVALSNPIAERKHEHKASLAAKKENKHHSTPLSGSFFILLCFAGGGT